MKDYDLKDKELLYHIDLNSNQSMKDLSKKVGIPKSSVDYRIKRLINNGVIINYYALIDPYLLGYNGFRLYIKFQYTTPKIEKEIIDYLLKKNVTGFIASPKEKYNLAIVSFINNTNEYYRFYEDLIEKYGYYFSDIIFSSFIKENTYSREYLLKDNKKIKKRIHYDIGINNRLEQLSDLNYKILSILSKNSKLSNVEIAKTLDSTPKKVKYQINKMIESGIILGYRINIDLSKLGIKVFKVDIFMKDYQNRKKIIEYIESNPNLWGIYFTTGHSQLELCFHLEDIDDLSIIMNDLIKKFPKTIRNYDYFSFNKFHRFSYFLK